jgi:hypothetical protein
MVELTTNKTMEKESCNILLWGKAGVGKTTLASTSEKPLFLMFDTNGDLSLKFVDNEVSILRYNEFNKVMVQNACGNVDDPFGIKKLIIEKGFKTIVLDSLSSLERHVEKYSVDTTAKAEFDQPTLQSYQKRFIVIREVINKLCMFANMNKLNFICIAHEGTPVKDEFTGFVTTSLLIGGKMPATLPNMFDEIWYMQEKNQTRELLLRGNPRLFPMKTRMFDVEKYDIIKWNYDIKKPDPKLEIKSWKSENKLKLNEKGEII